jgi:hypothetical protein
VSERLTPVIKHYGPAPKSDKYATMVPDENGLYVSIKDYKHLESRVRELESCCTIEAMLANPNVNSLITQHEKTIRALEAELEVTRGDAADFEAEVARLTALVQEHQTYQTKQGEK